MIFDPKQILEELSLDAILTKKISLFRRQALAILQGTSSKKIFIVGPCSIHSVEGAIAYAKKLRVLQEKVKDHLFLVMRTFIEKPRSRSAWNGFMHDPDLDGSCNILKGIKLSRKLFIQLTQLAVPTAMEFLDLNCSLFFQDIVTWGFIGARTCHSPSHRKLASLLPMPIGFKNGLDGHIEYAMYAVETSKHPQVFFYPNMEGRLELIKTQGNPYAHLVLRGSLHGPNYERTSIYQTKRLLQDHKHPPHLMIDCAHGNSGKSLIKQKKVFFETLELMSEDKDIFGLMLESNLLSGSQTIQGKNVGLSLTDPCLSFEETENMILEAYQLLSKSSSSVSESDRISASKSSFLAGISS